MDVKELQKLITEEKEKNNTLVLAHTYQAPEIIDIADITGDSFFLSKKAAEMKAHRVIMCGVRFMAEAVKILSPETEVILPVKEATCPMAEQILPKRVHEFKKNNPDTAVVAYINTTAELKAECDVCVTSSSAVEIVKKLPNEKVLFIPDKNLGSYVAEQVPEKSFILWDGFCPVHNSLSAEDVKAAKNNHPDAKFAVHPEAPAEVLRAADMIGSTSAIIKYAKEQSGKVIIGTEKGVVDYLSSHEKNGERFIQLSPEKLCCGDMKMTTLSDVYEAVIGKKGEIVELSEQLRLRAKASIDKMLELGE